MYVRMYAGGREYLVTTLSNPISRNGSGGSIDVTSTSLLCGVRAGGPDAWQRLVGLYGPMIYHWTRQHGFDESAAADVVQEVFVAVHRKVGDFRRDRPGDTFRGWIRRITVNKIRDTARRRRNLPVAIGGSAAHHRLQQIEDDAHSNPANIEAVDRQGEVHWLYQRALDLIKNQFETTTWEAFWMVTVDGRQPADVMADLQISRNAVYIAKSRVLSRLRAEFDDVID